jgi:hypothetical protein
MVTIYTEPGHKLLLRLIQHRLDGDISEGKFAGEYETLFINSYDPSKPESRPFAQRFRSLYLAVERFMGEPEEALPKDTPNQTLAELVDNWKEFDFSDVREVKVSL